MTVKSIKLIILVTIATFLAIIYLTLKYQMQNVNKENVLVIEKKYSINEIKQMIKELPDYQGDSLIIDDDGNLKSGDGLIQSVITQMYEVSVNIEGIRNESIAKKIPEQVLVYKTAIRYYLIQYGSKVKKHSKEKILN